MTEDNSTNATAAAVSLTVYELWIQLTVFYGLMGGVLSTIFSVLIWVGICRKKKFRNRFFIIVGCLTFVRTCIAVNFISLVTFRILRTIGIVATEQPRIICHSVHILVMHSLTVELTLLCTLVIDRMIAIAWINYYRLLTPRSALQICVAQYIFVAMIKLVPSYTGDDMFAIAKCINLYSFLNDTFNSYSTNIDLVMVFVVLLIYFVLIFYLRLRINVIKQAASKTDAGNVALQRQLKLMPMLRNLVLMHCGLALTAKLFLWLGPLFKDPAIQQRLIAFGGIMQAIDLFVNVVALLLTNADIRRAAIPFCLRNHVETMDATQTSKAQTMMSIRSVAPMKMADVD